MVVITDPSQDIKNKSEPQKWTTTDNLEQKLNAGMIGIEWPDSKSIWKEIWDTVSGRRDRASNAVSTFIKDKTQARGYDLQDALNIREEENALNQIDPNLLSEQDKIDHYNRLYFLENKYKELWPKNIDVEKVRNLTDSVLKSPTYIRVKRDEIKSADPQTWLPDRKSQYKTQLLEAFQEDVYNWIDKRDRHILNDDWWVTVYRAKDSNMVADSVIDAFYDRWLWYTLDHLAEYEDRIREWKDYDENAYRELKSQISNIRDFAIYATNNIEDTFDFDEVLRNYMDEWNTNPFVTINELGLMENSDIYHSRQLLLKDLEEDRKEHNWFWAIFDVLGLGMWVAQSVWDNLFNVVNAYVEWAVSLASWEWAAEARRNMNNTYALFDNTQYRGIYDNLKLGDKNWKSSWGKSFANNIVDAWPDFVNAFSSTPRLLGKTEKVVDLLENRLFWSKAADLIKKYDWWIKWFSAALKEISTTWESWHIPFIVARSIIKDWIIDNLMANAMMKWTAYREYSGTDLAFDVGSSILFDWILMLLKIKNLPISKEGNIFKAELVKKTFNISDREWSWMWSDTKDELWRIATSMIDVANESNPKLKEIVDKTSKYVEKKYKTAEAGIEWIINSVNKRSNNILIWASKDSKRKQYITQDQYWALSLKSGMSFNDMLTMRKDYDNKIMQYWKKTIAKARWFKTEWRNWNYMQQLLDAYKQQSNVIDWIKSAIAKFKELKADEKANTLSDIKMVMSKWEREMFDIRKAKNNIKDAKNADEEYTQLQTFKFHIAEMKKMYIQASLERSRIVRNNLKSEDLRWNTVATAWKRNAYNWLKSWSATWWEVWSVSKLDRMWREFIMEDNININWEEYFNKIFDHLKWSLDDDMVDLLLYTDRDIYNNRKENLLNILNIDYSNKKFFSNPVEVAYFVWPKWIIESTIDPNINLKYRYRWLNRSWTRAIFELISDDIEVPKWFRFEITAEWRMYISDWNLFRDILWWNWSWVEFKSALSWKDWWPTPDFVTPEERDQFNKDFSESAYLPTDETNKVIDETIANELDWFETSVTEWAKADNDPKALELKENQEEAHDAVTDTVESVQEADPNQEKVKWKTKIEKWVRSLLDLLKKDYWPYWEADGEFKIEDLEWVNFNSYDEDIEAFPTLRSMIDWSTYQKLLDKYNGEWLDLAKKKARLLWMVNMLVWWKWVYVDWNWNITFSLKWWDIRDWVSRPFVRKNWHQDFDVYIWDRGTFVTYSAETKSSAEEVAFNKRRRWWPNSQADKYLDIHVQEYEKTWKTWRWISRLKEDNPEEKILEAYKATGNWVEWLVVRWINHDRTAWHVNWTITFIRDADVKDVEVIMKEQLDVSNIDNIKNYFWNWLWDTKELDWIKNANTAQEIILEWEKRWLITNIDNNIAWKLNELYDNLRWEAIEIWAQKIAKKYSWRFDVNTISDTLTPYYMVDRTNINNLLDEFNTRYPSAIIWVEKWSPENYWLMNMVNKWQQFKERRWWSRNYRRSVSWQLHVGDNELKEVWITDEELRQIAKNRLTPNNYRAKDIDIWLKNKLNKIADNKCKLIRDKINNFIKLEIDTISIRDQWKKKTQELRDIWMRKPKETRSLGREIIQIAVDYNNRINELDNIIKDIWLSNDISWAQSSNNRWEQYISSLRHMKEWHQNFINRNYHLIFWLPTTISEAWFKETIDVPSKPKKVPVQEALPLTEEVKDTSEKFEIKVKDDSLDVVKEQKTWKTLSSLWYQSDILWQWPWASSNVDSKEFVRIVTTLKDFILNNWIDNVIVRFWDAAWIAMTTAARLARLENPKITITQYLTDKKRYQEVMENLALWNQSKFVWNSDAVYNYAELHRKESSTVINNQMFEDIVGNSDYVFTFDWWSNFNDYQYIKNKVWAIPVDLHSKFANWVNSLRIYWEWDEFISNSPIENIDAIIKKFESESPAKSSAVGKEVKDKISEITDDVIAIGKNDEWITPTMTTQSELDYIKAEAIKNWTFLKAPNWKPSNLSEDNWLQVRTKDFKDWFWDWENDPKNASKVVDENWEPLLVYHGWAKWIERFRLAASWKESTTWYWFYEDRKTWEKVPVDSNRAIFFSDKYWVSSYYATLYWYNKVKNTDRLVRWLLWTIVLDGRRDVLPNLKEVSKELWITPKEWAIRACDLLAIFDPEFNNIKKRLLDNWNKLTKKERKEIQDKIYETIRTDKYKEMMNVDSTNTYWTINSLSESLRFVSEYNNPEWIKKLKNWEIPVIFDKWFKNMANKSSLWYIQRFWVEKLNTEDPWSMDWFTNIDIIYWQQTKDWPDLNLYIKWSKFNWRYIKDLSESEIKELLDLLQRVSKAELDYRKWQAISQYKENSQVYSAFLNIRNPFAHDYEWSWIWTWVWYKWDEKMPTWYINARQVNKAINEWYDWVIYENISDPYLANNYWVFNPDNIRFASQQATDESVLTKPWVVKESQQVNIPTPVTKIISWWQSWADRLWLEIAKELWIETWWTAPKWYRTEVTSVEWQEANAKALKSFWLIEDESSSYRSRTMKNINNSDWTIILASNINSPWTRLTINYANQQWKPVLIINDETTPNDIKEWLNNNSIQTLNVAGNRASTDKAWVIYWYWEKLKKALSNDVNPAKTVEDNNHEVTTGWWQNVETKKSKYVVYKSVLNNAQQFRDNWYIPAVRRSVDWNPNHSFWNPYAWSSTLPVWEATEKFRQWLKWEIDQDFHREQREWIVSQIQDWSLKDKKGVVYYTNDIPSNWNDYWVKSYDKDHPNHAMVLKQFIDWEETINSNSLKAAEDNNYEVVTDEWQKPETDIFENVTEVKDNEAQDVIVDDVVEQFAETKTITPNYIDSLWEGWRWEFSPWRVDELVKVKSWKIDKELKILPETDTSGKFWIRSYAIEMNNLLKKDNLISKDIQSKLIEYETSGKDFWDPDFELFLSYADVLALANWLPIYNWRFNYYKEKYHLKDGVSRVTLLKNILNDVHKNYWIITITKDWKIFLSDKDNMIQKRYKEYGKILSWLEPRIDYMSRGLNYESQIRYGNKNTEDLYNDIIIPEIQSLEKQIKDIEDSLEEVSKTAKRIKKGWKEILQSTDMYNKLEQIEKLKKDIEDLKQTKRWDIHILAKKYESIMKSIWDLTKEKYYDSTWNIIIWKDQVSDSIWWTGKISYNTEKNPDFWIDTEDTGDAMHGSHRWPVDRGTDISSMQNEDDLMINPNWVEIKELSGWKWEKTSPSFLKKYWIGDGDYIRMKRIIESDANKFEEKIISDWDYQWWANEDWLDIPREAMDVFIKYAQRMARVNSIFKRISKNWVKIRDKFYWEWFWPMRNLTKKQQRSLPKYWPLRYWSIAWKNPVVFFTRKTWNTTPERKVLPTWYIQFVNALVLTNTPESAYKAEATIDLKKFLQLEKTSKKTVGELKDMRKQQDMDMLLDSYYYDLNYDVSKLKWDDLKDQQEIIDKLKKYQDKANEIIDDMIKKWEWPKTELWKDVVLRSVLTELLVHNPPKIWLYELEIPKSLIDYKFNWESNSLKWWRLPDKLYKNAIWFKQVSYALDSNMWVLDKSVMWELLNNLNNPNWWYVLIYWDNVNWISQIEKNLIDLWYEPVTNQSYDYAPIMNKEWYLYRPKKPSKEDFLKQADEIERVDNFIQSNSAQGCK